MSLLTAAPFSTLVVVSFAVVALAGCDASIHIGGDTIRRVESDTVASADVRAIDVSTDDGRVEVIGRTSSDEIEIHVVMTERDAGDADYSIEIDDGVLDLDGECDDGWFNACSVAFVVTMPADRSVDVSTDNGAITLTDLAGPVDVHTDNGAVHGSGLTGDTIRARTANGRIDLAVRDGASTVDVHTRNGAIDVVVPDVAWAVDAGSDNGRVDVDVARDDGAPRSIVAESDNGAIDIDVIDIAVYD